MATKLAAEGLVSGVSEYTIKSMLTEAKKRYNFLAKVTRTYKETPQLS